MWLKMHHVVDGRENVFFIILWLYLCQFGLLMFVSCLHESFQISFIGNKKVIILIDSVYFGNWSGASLLPRDAFSGVYSLEFLSILS